MRLTSILFRNARQPQDEKKVPFRAMTPLVLKNYVTTKNRTAGDRGCLYEMSMLLSCLEENDYEDKNCIPQFDTFNTCYKRYNHNIHKIKSETKEPVPNSKSHSTIQISSLLRKFPTK